MTHWTIGRSYAAIVGLALIANLTLGAATSYLHSRIATQQEELQAHHGRATVLAIDLLEHFESERAELLNQLLGDASANTRRLEQRNASQEIAADLKASIAVGENGDTSSSDQLASATAALIEWEAAADRLASRVGTATPDELSAMRAREIDGPYDRAHTSLSQVRSLEKKALAETQGELRAASKEAVWYSFYVACATSILLSGVAYPLATSISRRISGAIQHVQSASSELQVSATQQASSTKEQITTVTEVANTFNELHATTRQIADSAQRVATIAHDAASSAEAGNVTVATGQEAVGNIKNEVEVVVHYMLDLGRKSQQIGGILELINEHADQTNILAINASIEAAGAGEAGARFGVVADEIRKLADRVGGSTKEIRTLIDEIRASVNTTVMATESGSKAVDLGVAKFGEVTEVFGTIGRGVVVVSEAAREIELGTRQQATAVEQVGIAINGLQQVARETESATSQTSLTAQRLATLANDLGQLVAARHA